MLVQPYLFFDGRCEEAIEFYHSKIGAQVEMLMRFKDSPEPHQHPPGAENKVCIQASRSATRRFWRPTAAASGSRAFRVSRRR